MMNKYGFASFVKKTAPIAHPRRPFNIAKDLKKGDLVCVYVTPTRLVSKRSTHQEEAAEFIEYLGNNLVHIVLRCGRAKVVDLSYIRSARGEPCASEQRN